MCIMCIFTYKSNFRFQYHHIHFNRFSGNSSLRMLKITTNPPRTPPLIPFKPSFASCLPRLRPPYHPCCHPPCPLHHHLANFSAALISENERTRRGRRAKNMGRTLHIRDEMMLIVVITDPLPPDHSHCV